MAVSVDYQRRKTAELHLERKTTAIPGVGQFLKATLGQNTLAQMKVFNESFRTCVMDEHTNTSDTSKSTTNLGRNIGMVKYGK